MKLLVTTTADENIKDMTDLTHPIIKKFAKKWGADFLVLDQDANYYNVGDLIALKDMPMAEIHYRIMQLYDLLDEYDRIVQLDSDIVINKDCPNLFNCVSYDKIGTIFEDKGSRRANRRNRIRDVQNTWGYIGWEMGYINTGVFIVSQMHREIFRKFRDQYWTKLGFDCIHLGYLIHRLGLKIHELNYRFNHMSMFSEEWNRGYGSLSRYLSYIIHYAGQANFPDRGDRTRVELIRDDIQELWGDQFSK